MNSVDELVRPSPKCEHLLSKPDQVQLSNDDCIDEYMEQGGAHCQPTRKLLLHWTVKLAETGNAAVRPPHVGKERLRILFDVVSIRCLTLLGRWEADDRQTEQSECN